MEYPKKRIDISLVEMERIFFGKRWVLKKKFKTFSFFLVKHE
jgi:hypothetical protein